MLCQARQVVDLKILGGMAEAVPGALNKVAEWNFEVNGRKARTFIAPEKKAPLILRHPNGRLAGRFVVKEMLLLLLPAPGWLALAA